MTIGERVRAKRIEKGISVKELARQSGLAPSTLYDLENGRQNSSTKLHRVAEVLGTTTAELEHGEHAAVREPRPTYGVHRRSLRLSRIVERLDQAERADHLTPAILGIIEQAVEILPKPRKSND